MPEVCSQPCVRSGLVGTCARGPSAARVSRSSFATPCYLAPPHAPTQATRRAPTAPTHTLAPPHTILRITGLTTTNPLPVNPPPLFFWLSIHDIDMTIHTTTTHVQISSTLDSCVRPPRASLLTPPGPHRPSSHTLCTPGCSISQELLSAHLMPRSGRPRWPPLSESCARRCPPQTSHFFSEPLSPCGGDSLNAATRVPVNYSYARRVV